MSLTSGRGHEALRRGRWSKSGADYFLTLCTHDRQHGLTEMESATAILTQAYELVAENIWRVRTVVIMPDHLHLLISLGEAIELSSAVRLFKGWLAPALRRAGLRWQRAYFDHRLRPEEDPLPVFLYIFLNPYRANLVQSNQTWPGYFCTDDDWCWFGELTNASCPLPEWLR
jgi:REP element-mobilizing transposase RayT